ncbi:hypothetical protein BCR32DRAFT_302623 [Anaeromyces robustus]|uniref:G-protein coupled receptors family 3 profile domain-containing protein n=1 Tax=Anaeromyces robustus TaxID=1754192 RepID=A0A1Y1WV42_9FUNG|nr:hypothetical protein BCR32DRAFT_302623 [Anaeromyces robustus]|eukprot:ORX77417.1 hypothetical protein BCR32DRAFT_302623 [Anaeromyces robustus]
MNVIIDKMLYCIYKVTFVIFFFTIFFSSKVFAKVTINILMKKPELNKTKYNESQINLMNEYFNTINANDTLLQNYNINFSYCENTSSPLDKQYDRYKYTYLIYSEYSNYVRCVTKELKKSNYDLMIVDDRFLFSDYSFVKHEMFSPIYNLDNQYIHNFLVNYLEYNNNNNNNNDNTNTNNMKFNYINNNEIMDMNIINDGYLNDKENDKLLYGLPYELDFDVLYYYKDDEKLKNSILDKWKQHLSKSIELLNNNNNNIKYNTNLLNNIINSSNITETITTNTTTTTTTNINNIKTIINDDNDGNKYDNIVPLSIGLGDDDEMLNTFIEYICNIYGVPKSNDSHYFDIFYKESEKAEKIFQSYRNLLIDFMGSSLTQSLDTTIESAYSAFVNQEKLLFKGKASYFNLLQSEVTKSIDTLLLPNYHSVINEKYLVINNSSKIDPNVLIKVANQLTSEEAQLYRAEILGSIPTFNYTNQLNPSIQKYCQNHSLLCQILEKLEVEEPIHIKNMFTKSEWSPSFLEVRLHLPKVLKEFLKNNKTQPMIDTYINTFYDREWIDIRKFNIPTTTILIMILVYVMILGYIMYLVQKNKNHPYLKVLSPSLCNLIILSFIANIFFIFDRFCTKSIWQCYTSLYTASLARSLFYLPMWAITFRIYRIYTNITKVNFGKRLNDNHILTYLTIIIISNLILCTLYIFLEKDKYYLLTMGYVMTHRFFYCYSTYDSYLPYINFHYVIIVISMLIMMIKSGKATKIFKEYRFIILIFVPYIFGFFLTLFIRDIPDSYYAIGYITAFLLFILFNLSCVYFLVGSRLLYIYRHIGSSESLNNIDCENHHNNNNNNNNNNNKNENNFEDWNRNINNEFANIADFISMKKDFNSSYWFNFSWLNNKNTKKKKNNRISDDNDPIINNPNNYFFNESLENIDILDNNCHQSSK